MWRDGAAGGAVTRSLLAGARAVRALTRKPDGGPARALAELGANVVRVDMDDPASLRRAFDGVDCVCSVQNGMKSGFAKEVAQGMNVADAAKAAGVGHLVYASAGPGTTSTGVPSWEAKIPVEEHISRLDLLFTILRPLAFMELMTDSSFFPAVGTWRIMPRLTGDERPIPWLSVEDLGEIVAVVFANPHRFAGMTLTLTSDVRTLADCRSLYQDVMGRPPRRFPMPEWLFDRFTRGDTTAMWRWLRTGQVTLDTRPTKQLLPSALTVREWLIRVRRRVAEPA
jgi:uncharacterized protein YbjT (DUF2867 family)